MSSFSRNAFSSFLVIIAIVLICVVGGLYLLQKKPGYTLLSFNHSSMISDPDQAGMATATEREIVNSTSTNTSAIGTTVVDTLEWKTYKNEKLGFELKYPNTWDIQNEIVGTSSTSTNLLNSNERGFLAFALKSQKDMSQNVMNFYIISIDSNLDPKDFQSTYMRDLPLGLNVVSSGDLASYARTMNCTPNFSKAGGNQLFDLWGYSPRILYKNKNHYFLLVAMMTGSAEEFINKCISDYKALLESFQVLNGNSRNR